MHEYMKIDVHLLKSKLEDYLSELEILMNENNIIYNERLNKKQSLWEHMKFMFTGEDTRFDQDDFFFKYQKNKYGILQINKLLNKCNFAIVSGLEEFMLDCDRYLDFVIFVVNKEKEK